MLLRDSCITVDSDGVITVAGLLAPTWGPVNQIHSGVLTPVVRDKSVQVRLSEPHAAPYLHGG